MPQLFQLPQAVPLSSGGDLLPGSKLYFYQTGTTTPQDTYTDYDLTTAHANPVVADSDGVFAPIYLNPALPDYRVRLTDSANVQLWQIDDIPSNQNTAQTFRLKAAAPELIFEETDATSNNAKWAIRVNGEQLTIDLLNDAESVRTTIATLTRSGTSITAVNFVTDALQVNSETVTGNGSTSFTATLTGVSGTVTGTMYARRIGAELIMLYLNGTSLSGTSNTTASTITGVPSGYRPKIGPGATTRAGFCFVIDNGSTVSGTASINSSGVITLGVGDAVGGSFTNSGSKGLPSNWFFIFPAP